MPVVRLLPVLALVTAFFAPLAAVAQTPPPPAPAGSAAPMTHAHHGHRRHPSFMHALHALDLTPAQARQVASFHDQEKKANANADSATKRANAAKMRDQIMGILTPDQKTQLSAALHPSRGSQSGPVPSPAPSP